MRVQSMYLLVTTSSLNNMNSLTKSNCHRRRVFRLLGDYNARKAFAPDRTQPNGQRVKGY